MEVSLVCLMECAHSNPKELEFYEAESEWCYEGSVADALRIILRLSVDTHDAMKSVGASFSNLSIQDEVVSAVQEPSLGDADAPRLSLKKRCGVDESVLSDDRDASYLSPNKRRGSQLEPIEDQPVARPLGPSAPRPLGPSAPRPLGPSAPRPLGPSAPRPLGPSAPRPLGPSAPRPLAPSAPRPLGPSAPRPLGPSAKTILPEEPPCGAFGTQV